MKMLLCCPNKITPNLGGSKVYIEIANAMRQLGWAVTVIGPEDLGTLARTDEYRAALRSFLKARAGEFDVVEYEHDELPFSRSEFSSTTLFVARSVLLTHHFLTTMIPPKPGLRGFVGHLLFGKTRQRHWQHAAARATRTCENADIVNVPTSDDADALASRGIAPEKIVVLPFALSAAARTALGKVPKDLLDGHSIAFVGTFDPRKGMRDLPIIVDRVSKAMPDVKIRLIGTRGMIPDRDGVLAAFPRKHRSRVNVYPTFEPEELPELLSGCSVGVFPSAVEGFAFGVLEMLAAGLPVVGYRVPGVSVMLPAEYLRERGDWVGVAETLIALLKDRRKLELARNWAQQRASEFSWEVICGQMVEAYCERLRKMRIPR